MTDRLYFKCPRCGHKVKLIYGQVSDKDNGFDGRCEGCNYYFVLYYDSPPSDGW